MARDAAWLAALRRYFCIVIAGNLAWEFVQLPLYTLWKTGSVTEIVIAVLHCTGGDILIAVATLVGSLLLLGTDEWPRARFHPVAAATLIAGVVTTAFSEHINTARGAWSYSDLMPTLPGTGIGLAPWRSGSWFPSWHSPPCGQPTCSDALTFPSWEQPRPGVLRTNWPVLAGDFHERARDRTPA